MWKYKLLYVIIIKFFFFDTLLADQLTENVRFITTKMNNRYLSKRAYTTIAIKNYHVLGKSDAHHQLGHEVMQLLIYELSQYDNCEFIDPFLFNNTIKEKRIKQVIRARDFFEIAKDLSADVVLTAVVFSHGIVNVSLYETQFGKRVFSDNLQAATLEKSSSGAVFRSLVLPGWGQFYVNQSLKGSIILASEIGLFLTAILMNSKNQKALEKLHQIKTVEEKSYYYNKISKSNQIHRLSLCAAFGIWAYSIIDAHAAASMLPGNLNYGNNPDQQGLSLLAENKNNDFHFKLQYQFNFN